MSSDEKTQLVPPPDPVAPGTQLSGAYELDERLASGGMGEVWRGHNIHTGDPVAIKIVLPEFARNPTILSLFTKEASILNHLFHEAIVRYHVFAVDQALGRPYLAMEYVDGKSIAQLLETGPMAPDDARRLLIRLASGLSVAHEAGVIHRDLSPDNIVLPGGRVDRAKIIDFGIARSANVGGETLLGGAFAGKYNFVSPEQLGLAGGDVTARSDIYSLGLVIAAALRGRTINMTGSQVEIIEKRRVVPDLAGLDPGMRAVLEAMLAPDPADRPQSMQEVVALAQSVGAPPPQRVWPAAGAEGDTTRIIAPPPGTIPPPGARPPPQTIPPGGSQQAAEAWPPTTDRTPMPWHDVSAGPVPGVTGVGGAAPPPPAPQPVPEAAPRRRVGGGVLAAMALLLVAAGGSGAYFGGLLDPFMKPVEVPQPVPEQPAEPEAEQPTVPAEPAPEPQPEPEPAPEPQPQPEIPPAPQPEEPAPQPEIPPAPEPEPQPEQPTVPEPAPEPQPQPEPEPQPPVEIPAEPTPPTVPEVPQQPAEEPAPAPEGFAARLAWLGSFSGGDCFYASGREGDAGKMNVEGFGPDVAVFERLLSEFARAFPSDPEPDVGVRLIRQRQCPLTGLQRLLAASASPKPALSVERDVIVSGESMVGQVALHQGRQTYLLLLDHDGIAHNLKSVMRDAGDRASFSVPLGLKTTSGQDPLPQVLLAISASAPLEALSAGGSVPSADLFPRLEQEVQRGNIDASLSARYFRVKN